MSHAQKKSRKIEEIAESHYDPALPYHNFSHALKTISYAREILSRCKTSGVEVDDSVVYYSLLFHDAGYREDFKAKGFASKEHYAAQLAITALTDAGFQPEFIRKVKGAIIGTHRDTPFTTNEQKVVRAADLAGLAADYEEFRHDTENLRKERELLTGKEVTIDEWKKNVRETVNFYLSQEIKIKSLEEKTYWDQDFHKRVSANVSRYLSEVA